MAVPSQYATEWCRSQHDVAWHTTIGNAFEDYMESVLGVFHDDFVNPSPAGKLGDRKCDGLAESGKIFYACYGSRQQPGSTEAAIVSKIKSDFGGAVEQWASFEEWRFVTNSRTGPDVAALIIELQAAYGTDADRPIRVRLWSRPTDVWNNLIVNMSQEQLDLVFPGRPGLVSPDLADLAQLLEVLSSGDVPDELPASIKEVPLDKMDFNELSDGTKYEMNIGRVMSPRIDTWYDEQGDPDLYDIHGARFRRIYLEHSSNHPGRPNEIMEGIYISLAGAGFKMSDTLANSVYTVTSYFFDRCHIFETPPEEEGDTNVVAD